MRAEVEDVAGPDHRRPPELLGVDLAVQPPELGREVVDHVGVGLAVDVVELVVLGNVGADVLRVACVGQVAAPDLMAPVA